MINNVYECGCVRNFTQKALKRTDFDLELKRRENGFLSENGNFKKLKRFSPEIDSGIQILDRGIQISLRFFNA